MFYNNIHIWIIYHSQLKDLFNLNNMYVDGRLSTLLSGNAVSFIQGQDVAVSHAVVLI